MPTLEAGTRQTTAAVAQTVSEEADAERKTGLRSSRTRKQPYLSGLAFRAGQSVVLPGDAAALAALQFLPLTGRRG